MGFWGKKDTLIVLLLISLLLSKSPINIVQARSSRNSSIRVSSTSGWKPLGTIRSTIVSDKVSNSLNGSMDNSSANRSFDSRNNLISKFPTNLNSYVNRNTNKDHDIKWIDLGNGAKIRAVPSNFKSINDEYIEKIAFEINSKYQSSKKMPLFQANVASSITASSSFIATDTQGQMAPVTKASSQPLINPSDSESSNVSSDYELGGKLKLPPKKNLQIRQLDFRDTPLQDALRSLAQLIDLNLMLHSNVQGTVTILFSNITVEEAFNTLLRNYELAFSWQGNILSIFPIANAPLVTRIFNIKNTNAAQVKEIIDKLLTPQRGKSEVDARTNSIMVTDAQHVIEQIKNLLPQIDVKEQEVEVTSRPVTEVFYLDYVDASNLTDPIKMIAPAAQIQAYSSSQASMAAAGGGTTGSGRMDMMIITDTQANLDRIRELIEKLDVAPIQVTIDAHIYEIDLNEEERLGINWQKQIPIPGTNENRFEMTIAPEDSNAGGTGVFRWGSLNVQQFQALLAMLKTKSFAKVLSNPVITTLNNRPANITVGQAIPYVSASQVNAQTGNVTVTVSQANANITLQVTPSVTGNDEVFLDINPTISSVIGFTTLGGNTTPNLSNRSARTQVIVKNHHTIVIGGMIKTDKNETVTKVPLLGDLPGIGQLFRKKTWREIRTELIIFITPHIIRNTSSKNSISKSRAILEEGESVARSIQ